MRSRKAKRKKAAKARPSKAKKKRKKRQRKEVKATSPNYIVLILKPEGEKMDEINAHVMEALKTVSETQQKIVLEISNDDEETKVIIQHVLAGEKVDDKLQEAINTIAKELQEVKHGLGEKAKQEGVHLDKILKDLGEIQGHSREINKILQARHNRPHPFSNGTVIPPVVTTAAAT